MKQLIAIGLILILSGCAAMTEKYEVAAYKRVIERRAWNFVRQPSNEEYYIFTYRVDITSDLGKKMRAKAPMIDNFPNGKWIEGMLHVRCDKFSRPYSILIRDIDERLLYWEKNDEWERWYWGSVIEGLCRDERICGWK